MAPKKAQKMSLNEFLGDSTLGSWADEMDALPTAPSGRPDEERGNRRDDFLSTRPDRSAFPPREDLPLPTEPPYTAFIGNLAFDLTESELEDFFGGAKTKSVKIIKDRDEKPKGFGYIEFADLDGLKDALAKSNLSLAGRNIRVSVAEPPKERSGFGGGSGFDDDKFASNWRRDGPLPDLPGRGGDRDGSRRRFDGPPTGGREPLPPAASDNVSDWRSAARPRASPAPESEPQFKRRGSGFSREGTVGAADTEETWAIGSKFKPSAPPSEPGSRFGSTRGRGDMGPPSGGPSPPDEGDWRSRAISRNSTSPSNSTPPTPQLSRRKLELLPRNSVASTASSPLSSPNPANPPSSRSNPFGAAKPVDVSAKEKAVEERLEKEKERVSHTMSRTSSRTAVPRSPPVRTASPAPGSPIAAPISHSEAVQKVNPAAAVVRPSFSFANAAKGKRDTEEAVGAMVDEAQEVTEKIAEVEV